MFQFFHGKPDKSKRLYEYFDGQRTRLADPISIIRLMAAHETFDVDKHLAEMTCGEAELEAEASLISVKATRDIFGIVGWTEATPDGLTELETLGVLNDFVLYVEELKKNGNGQQT